MGPSASALPAEQPSAARHPVKLEKHGDVRSDPYFWLRERENPEVIAYLEAENAYTEAVMAHTVALQDKLYEEIVAGVNATQPGFSQIRRFSLLEREFTQEDGELTPTMKIKRFAINRKYKDVIDAMYPEDLAGDEE